MKVGRELNVDIPRVIWHTIADELLLLSSSSDQDQIHSYTPFYMFFYWLTFGVLYFYPIPIIIYYITPLSTHTFTHTVKHVHLFITEPVAQLVLACAAQMAVIDYCPVWLLDPSSIIAHLIIYVPLLCDLPKQTLKPSIRERGSSK